MRLDAWQACASQVVHLLRDVQWRLGSGSAEVQSVCSHSLRRFLPTLADVNRCPDIHSCPLGYWVESVNLKRVPTKQKSMHQRYADEKVATAADSKAKLLQLLNEFCNEFEAGGEFLESGQDEGLCTVSAVDNNRASTDFLETCLSEQRFDFQSCLEVLRTYMVKFPVPRRRGLEGDAAYAILGLYCHGGMRGITSFTKRREGIVRYLNGFIAHHNPMGRWAAIYLSKNTTMPLHRDSRNARQGKAWIVALGDFIGGGLWVATENGAGPCLRRLPDGHLKAGQVLDIHECPQVFDGLGWHGAEPWYGNDRWVVVAYTPLNSPEAFTHNKQSLADLGFPLPGVQHLGTELHAGGMEGLRPQKVRRRFINFKV